MVLAALLVPGCRAAGSPDGGATDGMLLLKTFATRLVAPSQAARSGAPSNDVYRGAWRNRFYSQYAAGFSKSG